MYNEQHYNYWYFELDTYNMFWTAMMAREILWLSIVG